MYFPFLLRYMLAMSYLQRNHDPYMARLFPYLSVLDKKYNIYCKVMVTQICLSPRIALFSIIPGSVLMAKKDVLRHFLAAMRTFIPRYWKSTVMPSFAKWISELETIWDLECLISQMSQETDKSEQFHKTWATWSMFWVLSLFNDWIAK